MQRGIIGVGRGGGEGGAGEAPDDSWVQRVIKDYLGFI